MNISWTRHSAGQHKQLCILHDPSNFKYFVIFICQQSEHSLKQSELSDSISHVQDLERGSMRQSSLKGQERAIVNQTNTGTVSKATLGKLLRQGGARMGFSERIDIFNRTELDLCTAALTVNHVPVNKQRSGLNKPVCCMLSSNTHNVCYDSDGVRHHLPFHGNNGQSNVLGCRHLKHIIITI